MTDHIPADKVREIIARYRDGASGRAEWVLDALKALLPAPLTLADMNEEERLACRWMQADVEGRSMRYVIANPCDAEGDAALTSADGEIEWFSPERVTPRPDLPRMEWPGTEKPEPAPALPDGWRLADHKKHGRVIVTTEKPDDDGLLAFVHRVEYLHRQHDNEWCKPAELTFLDTDQGADQ